MGSGREKWIGRIIIVLIGLGVFLRVNRYLCNFPFWGDEAWVALDVLERSFRDICLNVNHADSLPLPPVGFLLIEKLLVTAFDFRETVFRFFPCACGVVSIFLYRKWLKELVSQRVMLMAMAFFVFSHLLIYYSSELKQYSSDVLVVISMYLLHYFMVVRKPLDTRGVVVLIAAGYCGLLISPVVILVLCCLAVVQIVIYYKKRMKELRNRYCLVLVFWLAGFVSMWSYYYNATYSPHILEYYKAYYLSCPLIGGDWGAWWKKLFVVFTNPVGLSWPWLSALMFVTGGWELWKKDKAVMLALITPIIFTAGLSVLSKYPFYGRFLIFLLPVLFIFIAQGVACVMNGCYWRRILGLVILVGLLAQPIANARNYVVPSSDTDIRSLILYIKAHQQPDDYMYFNNEARWGAAFYYDIFSFPYDLRLGGILNEYSFGSDQLGEYFFFKMPDQDEWRKVYGWGRVLDEYGVMARMPSSGRAWILLSLVAPEKERAFISCFDAFGKKLDEKHSHNASLYLYDLK